MKNLAWFPSNQPFEDVWQAFEAAVERRAGDGLVGFVHVRKQNLPARSLQTIVLGHFHAVSAVADLLVAHQQIRDLNRGNDQLVVPGGFGAVMEADRVSNRVVTAAYLRVARNREVTEVVEVLWRQAKAFSDFAGDGEIGLPAVETGFDTLGDLVGQASRITNDVPTRFRQVVQTRGVAALRG